MPSLPRCLVRLLALCPPEAAAQAELPSPDRPIRPVTHAPLYPARASAGLFLKKSAFMTVLRHALCESVPPSRHIVPCAERESIASTPGLSLRVAVLGACLGLAAHAAQAQAVTKIVVAFPPGGPQDVVARLIAEPLARPLGGRVIVDNKPGANGAVAAAAVAHAAPDGHTLWLTSVGATVVNPFLYERLAYDIDRDFTPISLVAGNSQLLVVRAGDPVRNAADLVAESKQAARPPAIGSSGIGSVPHLVIEQLVLRSGARLLHAPYRGTAASLTDLMGGQIRGLVADTSGLAPYVASGRVRAVGIAAARRAAAFPDVPTFAEQGLPPIDGNNWYALFAGRKVPQATLARLNGAVRQVLADPAVQERLRKTGSEPASSTRAELAALLRSDREKWGRLIREAGIKAEPGS
ncbi:Bug family tripartite tricarboxylate transporter substrate binding protein [Xylophilus sp.]|uniref:Bug family tripartite tricarboxylate transporter substrate binding protein n=1 Tax=Xylophilus sp. TaxID=2653893 RepID=UPI0013B9D2E1|nr:tripartite tricarboxylate transporter substrate binding protein [Xylophilus sp.]KAF1047516.1 MAG: hypothetical protein GAK38_01867 [Xylophilus sp.]